MIGCLEIGGSHFSVGALAFDHRRSNPVPGFVRLPVDSRAPLPELLEVLSRAAGSLTPRPSIWVTAVPGPFDYSRGIGGAHPDGKFAALAGQDCRQLFGEVLQAQEIHFVNDAEAFAVGCAIESEADHPAPGQRLLALTFGSGIGSAFLENGHPVTDERVPPAGELFRVPTSGGTFEEVFGPQALATRHGFDTFRDFAADARRDRASKEQMQEAFTAFAAALEPWLRSFSPDTVVCGGSVCRAWDVFGETLATALTEAAGVPLKVRAIIESEQTAMRGAVVMLSHAAQRQGVACP